MGWLAGWNKRKSHVMTQQAGAGNHYQIPIKVYKGVGADGTEAYHDVTMGKVYCGGNCQNDFGDIRFTASDGTTLLDYWMHDDVSSGVYAVFWVELTGDLTAGNVTIYIYYDTTGATATTENMTNTFQVAEDDQETAIGAVPVGWVDNSENTCSATVQNDQFKYGDRSHKINDCDAGVAKTTISGKSFSNYIVMDWYSRIKDCDYYARSSVSNGTKTANIYYDHGANHFSYLDASQYHAIATLADNTWYHIQAYYDWVNQKFVGLYLDGVWHAGNWTMRNPEFFNVYHGADQDAGTVGRLWIDCLFIRKYVSNVKGNDPAHGTWGTEETPPPPPLPDDPTDIRACCECI